ncbi:MAG TPA: hypothetical protein PKK00_12340 [Bacteroidales bacterium]|nr:hypothetical protein [Bacteroidales bacterium]HPS18017.1 hypothetical protein [Bacteroidales bacterium]
MSSGMYASSGLLNGLADDISIETSLSIFMKLISGFEYLLFKLVVTIQVAN